MAEIKFGTDGWRAVIALEYTFENLARVSAGTAKWIINSGITKNGVVIGYDARFSGKAFAECAAQVFAYHNIPVTLSSGICPTPAVSLAAEQMDAVGIVITASHNPPEYNGFKIKAPFGGSASPAQITAVEKEIPETFSLQRLPAFDSLKKAGAIRIADLTQAYLDTVSERIDLQSILISGITILHDAMYGSGAGLISRLLGDKVIDVRHTFNPGFENIAPEPVEKNLGNVPELILRHGASLGIANDGDADRVAMFDEKGQYVDSHQILSLLSRYMVKTRNLRGELVKTVSTTDMMRKIAEAYGLPIFTTPIGFKYITEKILEGDVLVCGEESGGIAVKGHLAERDGIFIGLLVAEMCAKRGKTLSELVQELFDEFGPHYCRRNDLHTTDDRKNKMIALCKAGNLKQIGGLEVTHIETTDGIKHWLPDNSWLLVRPSGTEPVLRIYSEASTAERAELLVNEISAFVESDTLLEQA
ncbi:MAG: phosphoglucomutase/phosphomannomutase family protein [Balneolales bacterium]|nr:phosphoglucomutase/phosphomannomutase family protein [Balneolales bacterium]